MVVSVGAYMLAARLVVPLPLLLVIVLVLPVVCSLIFCCRCVMMHHYQRVQRVPTRILVFGTTRMVPARILVLEPTLYVTISDHTCIIRCYHMHGNPVRISILLGITRTSLNNVKVRCVGKE